MFSFVGWGKHLPLQPQIDALSVRGGGRVVVPSGEWETGKIHLRSGVELHLEDGAILNFSDCPDDYLPNVQTCWQGEETEGLSPLVYALGCTNVAITGRGVLKTKNAGWGRWAENRTNRRPQFIQLYRCRNALLADFSIVGTPFWTLHLYRTADVVVTNLTISAFDDTGLALKNSDGIDIECSRHVRVSGCSFRQNDDAIVVKSGRDDDGVRRGIPTEDVLIEKCSVQAGICLFGIGSEVGGGIRNVVLRDCKVSGSVSQLMFIKTNAKRGGFIENVIMENIDADLCRGSVICLVADYWYYPSMTAKRLQRTPIHGVFVRNVKAKETDAVVDLRGDPELMATNVAIEDVHIETVKSFMVYAANVRGLHLGRIDVDNPPVVSLKRNDPSRGGQEADLPD